MPFGIWYNSEDELHIMDSTGEKIPFVTAQDRVREILAAKPKEELLTALMDRLDVNDIVGHITDAGHQFLPGVLPHKDGQ